MILVVLDRETDSHIHRQTDTLVVTDRQRDRHDTGGLRQRDRQPYTQTDRHTGGNRKPIEQNLSIVQAGITQHTASKHSEFRCESS